MYKQGCKYDGGKLRYDLIPTLSFEEVTKVVTKGTEKYDDENWKIVPEGRRRYLAAAMRHIQEWRKGNIYDDEMGTHHIANAISNLMFILEKELQGWGDTEEFHTGGFLPVSLETEDLTHLISEVRNLQEDVKRMNSHYETDISQEELKAYVESIAEVQKRKLWCDTCEGVGHYDNRDLGIPREYYNSECPCPDCGGKGYIEV